MKRPMVSLDIRREGPDFYADVFSHPDRVKIRTIGPFSDEWKLDRSIIGFLRANDLLDIWNVGFDENDEYLAKYVYGKGVGFTERRS